MVGDHSEPTVTKTLHSVNMTGLRASLHSVSATLHGEHFTRISLLYGLSPRVALILLDDTTRGWTDWKCPCGFINFERRHECLECGNPKLRKIVHPPSTLNRLASLFGYT